MKSIGNRIQRFCRLALAICGCLLTRVYAQSAQRVIEPQLLDLHLSDANFVMEAESRYQRETLASSGGLATYKAQSLAPAVDLALNGSIYHPNLIELSLKGQLGYDWERIAGTGLTNANANSWLQNYDARISLLKEKPFAATLTAGRSDYVREYDFFTTVRGQAQRFGGSAGYTEGSVPFTIEANRAETTTDGEPAPAFSRYDTVHLDARNSRAEKGHTELTYGYTQYRREYTGQSLDTGTDNTLQLSDTELWGAKQPSQLSSRLTYHHGDNSMGLAGDNSPFVETAGTHLSADSLNIQEHFEKPLSGSLRSLFDYSFDYYRQDGFANANHRGQAGLVHQLFESLTSSVDVHGGRGDSSGGTAEWNNDFYGLGLGEVYSKQLSSWGHLNLGFQGTLDRQNNQASASTATVPIFQERHTLNDGTVTFLNLLQIDGSSVRVTDSSGINVYREIYDYEVIPHGEQTEIRRVSGGTIPNGSTVLVDYRAANPSSARGVILTDTFFIRLELFQGLVGVYARLSQNKSSGDAWLGAQNSTDRIAGVEVSGREGSLLAEYEIYDSDQTSYNSTRLAQSVSWPVGVFSHAGLSASENWNYFPISDQRRNTYQLIARYNAQLTSMLDFSIEGGKRLERGDMEDRDLTTARAEINCQVGDLSVRMSYELEGQTTPEEKRDRNRFYLRIKRAF